MIQKRQSYCLNALSNCLIKMRYKRDIHDSFIYIRENTKFFMTYRQLQDQTCQDKKGKVYGLLGFSVTLQPPFPSNDTNSFVIPSLVTAPSIQSSIVSISQPENQSLKLFKSDVNSFRVSALQTYQFLAEPSKTVKIASVLDFSFWPCFLKISHRYKLYDNF